MCNAQHSAVLVDVGAQQAQYFKVRSHPTMWLRRRVVAIYFPEILQEVALLLCVGLPFDQRDQTDKMLQRGIAHPASSVMLHLE